MYTGVKHIAALVATSIWADGGYGKAEKDVVNEIADAFGLNANKLVAAVEIELAVVEEMTNEELNEYLLEHAAEVDSDETEILLKAVAQVVVVDGVLGDDEVENVMSIASALGVDKSRAMFMLHDLMNNDAKPKAQPSRNVQRSVADTDVPVRTKRRINAALRNEEAFCVEENGQTRRHLGEFVKDEVKDSLDDVKDSLKGGLKKGTEFLKDGVKETTKSVVKMPFNIFKFIFFAIPKFIFFKIPKFIFLTIPKYIYEMFF